MNRIKILEDALKTCESLMQQDQTAGPFDYVAVQLRYIIALLKGENVDKARLKDINVGLVAIREFNTRFSEFADQLMEVEKIVDALRYGR